MIGAIMILAVVAYLVWTFWGRAFHVIGQYKKGGSQFKLSEPLDYEAIYQKLKRNYSIRTIAICFMMNLDSLPLQDDMARIPFTRRIRC